MAAKKSPKSKDPMKDKSSAIRRVIKRMPTANVNEVVAAVKDEFGHKVNSDRILMVKTKRNMVAKRNQTNTQWKKGHPVGAAQWIEAIKIAQQLLKVTGSVDNATALLNALDTTE
jgi:ribosomal protein L23